MYRWDLMIYFKWKLQQAQAEGPTQKSPIEWTQMPVDLLANLR